MASLVTNDIARTPFLLCEIMQGQQQRDVALPTCYCIYCLGGLAIFWIRGRRPGAAALLLPTFQQPLPSGTRHVLPTIMGPKPRYQ